MAFSSLFTKDGSTETEESTKKNVLIKLINILALDIVNPPQLA